MCVKTYPVFAHGVLILWDYYMQHGRMCAVFTDEIFTFIVARGALCTIRRKCVSS